MVRSHDIQAVISRLAGERRGVRRPPNLTERLASLVKRRNRGESKIFPDEIDVLTEICRLIDSETDPSLAWEKVEDVEKTGVYEQPCELDTLIESVGYNLLDSTVCYINLATADKKIASGVLIEINGRFFVATTAHSVPANPSGKLSFVGRDARPMKSDLPRFLTWGKSQDSKVLDVAYLEITPELAVIKFGKSAIPLSRVYPCSTGNEKLWTVVAGYPAEEVRSINDQILETSTKLFTVQCWGNTVLGPDRWNALKGEFREPNPEWDVFISYPRNDEFIAIGPLKNWVGNELSEPYGMSGCGYWQPQMKLKRKVFSPDYYSLIAIQSHWWGRYLQATQIIHWLRLLYEQQPDLRGTLTAAFPRHNLG